MTTKELHFLISVKGWIAENYSYLSILDFCKQSKKTYKDVMLQVYSNIQ